MSLLILDNEILFYIYNTHLKYKDLISVSCIDKYSNKFIKSHPEFFKRINFIKNNILTTNSYNSCDEEYIIIDTKNCNNEIFNKIHKKYDVENNDILFEYLNIIQYMPFLYTFRLNTYSCLNDTLYEKMNNLKLNFNNIHILDLSYCCICNTDIFYSPIKKSNLEVLSLTGNYLNNIERLTDGIVESNIKRLILSYNKTIKSNYLLKNIGYTKIECLNLENCNINDDDFINNSIYQTTKFKTFYLSRNNIKSLKHFKSMGSIKYFYLTYNFINEITYITHILSNSKIHYLYLEFNNLNLNDRNNLAYFIIQNKFYFDGEKEVKPIVFYNYQLIY